MAAPVYSTAFIGVEGTETFASYVVPAGYVAVIRDISAVLIDNADESVVQVSLGSGTYIWKTVFASGLPFEQFTGRQVVDAGEVIYAGIAGGTPISVRVCGYLLTIA